jgi:hypothetical protein
MDFEDAGSIFYTNQNLGAQDVVDDDETISAHQARQRFRYVE